MKKVLIIMLVISSLVFSSCSKKPESSGTQTEQGTGKDQENIMQAPDFGLTSLKGNKVRLSDYRGKVVVLNFFATWCPPCRAELPDFMQAREALEGKDVQFVFVDLQEEKKIVEEFLSSRNYNFDPLMDDGSVSGQIYGIRSIPTSFIIDQKGNISDYSIGPMSKSQITASVEKLLGKK